MSSSIDQQFIEFVVKSLVSNPDDVSIVRTIDEKGVLLELTVHPDDLGRVIGKRGATAQSLRTLLRALGTKNEARYNLKIVDNGEPRPPREDHPERDDRPERKSSANKEEKSDNEEPAPEPESEKAEEPVAEVPSEEVDHEDVISKTRKELADLDDLDV